MATISFDTKFKVQEQHAASFFDAWEKNIQNPKPIPYSPYVNKESEERGEELLRRICCR